MTLLLLAEDEAGVARIQARNRFESYAYRLRNLLTGERLINKIDAAVDDAIQWLDGPHEASKDEYEEKQKELEGVVDLIVQKLCSAAGGAGGF